MASPVIICLEEVEEIWRIKPKVRGKKRWASNQYPQAIAGYFSESVFSLFLSISQSRGLCTLCAHHSYFQLEQFNRLKSSFGNI